MMLEGMKFKISADSTHRMFLKVFGYRRDKSDDRMTVLLHDFRRCVKVFTCERLCNRPGGVSQEHLIQRRVAE